MNEVTTPNNTTTHLPPVYYEMIGYRMVGLTYGQIAARTGYSEDWIKHLFARDGVLYTYWRAYVEDKKKGILEQVMDTEWGNLEDIVVANVLDAKKQNSMVGVIARKMIFDRTLGPAPQKVNLSGSIGVVHGTFAEWAEAMQAKLDARAQRGQSTTVPTEPD
jgi:hypothetical protein